MKLAAVCLLLGWTVSALATKDSILYRLNSSLQSINEEKDHRPISMVIAVQTNLVPNDASISKIRAMLEPLVSSGRGEIEVLSYGDQARIIVAQPFTSDSTKVAQAIAYVSTSSAFTNPNPNVSEAIGVATSDLAKRPANRRQLILILGENPKDGESESELNDVIDRASGQLRNLAVLFPLAF